jgi:hypothetical protein
MIYPDLSSFKPYVQRFDIKDKQWLQWDEQRAQKIHVMKGEMISYPLPEGYETFYILL